jgi:hypothetical protein
MIRPLLTPLLVAGLLAGCVTPPAPDENHMAMAQANVPAPPDAPAGTCWARDATPAVIETVTEQIELRPAQLRPDGSQITPALYSTETRQQIVQERREMLFETPCNAELTGEFIASLQRALQVRGYFNGNPSGVIDARTRNGIRAYQRGLPQPLDSAILSMTAARALGLVAVLRTEG